MLTRQLVRQLLREMRRRARRTDERQPPLPITRVLLAEGLRVEVKPLTGVLFPWEIVPCRLGGTLLVRSCLDRRSAVWPSGHRRGRPMKLECQGCPLGEAYAARSPWHIPPKPSQPAEVKDPEQRAAKMRWDAEHVPDDQPWMDPMREAASLTPDDDGTEA